MKYEFASDMGHMLAQWSPAFHHSALPGYAQASQDLLALWALGRGLGEHAAFPSFSRSDLRYLELGAFHPVALSNTLLLEQLGWTGESVDIDGQHADLWEHLRRQPLVIADALDRLAERVDRVKPDYLSIDIDEGNGAAISGMLAATHRPKLITVETNEYLDGGGSGGFGAMAESMLSGANYHPIARRVMVCGKPFEGWYWYGEPPYRFPDDADHAEHVIFMIENGLSVVP